MDIDETINERVRRVDLIRLSDNGNVYAKEQLRTDVTGLGANIQAFMRKPCDHTKHLPNGRRIRADSWCESVKVGEFKIQERICTLCTKTLERRIWKPK